MSLDTPADRLRWARKHHGQYQTATEAARAFGWPVSTYLGHENGDRNPSRDAAKRYARAYHVRWEWLLENEGPPVDAPGFDIVTVPVLSWEGAADLLNEQAHIPVENVPLMAFAQLGRGRFLLSASAAIQWTGYRQTVRSSSSTATSVSWSRVSHTCSGIAA